MLQAVKYFPLSFQRRSKHAVEYLVCHIFSSPMKSDLSSVVVSHVFTLQKQIVENRLLSLHSRINEWFHVMMSKSSHKKKQTEALDLLALILMICQVTTSKICEDDKTSRKRFVSQLSKRTKRNLTLPLGGILQVLTPMHAHNSWALRTHMHVFLRLRLFSQT